MQVEVFLCDSVSFEEGRDKFDWQYALAYQFLWVCIEDDLKQKLYLVMHHVLFDLLLMGFTK